MNKSFPIGETIVLRSLFDNPQTGQATNPNSVVCRLLDPNGVEQRPAVTNVGVGLFYTQFVPTVPGTWHARWEANGTVKSITEYEFTVRPTPFQT